MFAPVHEEIPQSKDFKQWLRESFKALLVGKQSEINAMAQAITPHSFRAGMASDLERSDVPRLIIKKLGRWASMRAMEQYMRDGLAQRLRKIQYRTIAANRNKVKRIIVKTTTVKTELDESEGYDDSAHGTDTDSEL